MTLTVNPAASGIAFVLTCRTPRRSRASKNQPSAAFVEFLPFLEGRDGLVVQFDRGRLRRQMDVHDVGPALRHVLVFALGRVRP